eukprot:2654002-Pyramimonas_sp.AAC.1
MSWEECVPTWTTSVWAVRYKLCGASYVAQAMCCKLSGASLGGASCTAHALWCTGAAAQAP